MNTHKAAGIFEQLREDLAAKRGVTLTDVLERAYDAGQLGRSNLTPESQLAAIIRIAKKRLRIEQASGDVRRALEDAYTAGANDAGRALAAKEKALEAAEANAFIRGKNAAVEEACDAFRDWASDHGVELVPREDLPDPVYGNYPSLRTVSHE